MSVTPALLLTRKSGQCRLQCYFCVRRAADGDVQIGAGAASPDPVPRTRAVTTLREVCCIIMEKALLLTGPLTLTYVKATITGFTFKTLY